MARKIRRMSLAPEYVLGVSDCIALINQTLEYAYSAVAVEGEVASFKVNHNNYVFFDLKDDSGTLGCFMTVWQLRVPLENGMKVRVVAVPKITAWGKFSLTVREVVPVGEGSLKRAYEMLRNKLNAEGLFAPDRKRQIPRYVEHIGLISSKQAAGYADFMKIVAARWPLAKIDVCHSRVQGAGAADGIIAAIHSFNEMAHPPEVIAVVRGGGSADDLACFNDELLVRAVAASRVPVVAGIGHETDETLASLAADIAASTPSNAAELIAPDGAALMMRLGERRIRLNSQLGNALSEQKQSLRHKSEQLQAQTMAVLAAARQQIVSARSLLHQLDPQTVLRRGYSVVRAANGHVIRGGGVAVGDRLNIETAHDIIDSEVIKIYEK